MGETSIWIVIVVVTIGFFALAGILLIPIYRFLLREEEVAKEWVEGKVGRKSRESSSGDGMPGFEEETSIN